MSSNEPVMQFLDKVINDFKEEFQAANSTVEEMCFLESYVMNRLMKGNARAQAALAVKTIIKDDSSDQGWERVIPQIKKLMDKETKAGSYSVARFYEQILTAVDKHAVMD